MRSILQPSMQPALPRYLDAMLGAWHRGQTTRAVHLGLWDDASENPPTGAHLATPGAFAAAQARLDAGVLATAAIAPGMRVLDVGCGLGSTLAALDRRTAPLQMTGLNADPRQLAVCAGLRARAGSTLSWVLGDACALPFADGVFDRVLCVEALFHFSSRAVFLREAARVLAPGGSLVLTDLHAHRGDTDDETLAADVAAGFGPWPAFWMPRHEGLIAPVDAGLVLVAQQDWTTATLPSHHVTAPTLPPSADPVSRACAALARLHRSGRLTVWALHYRRA